MLQPRDIPVVGILACQKLRVNGSRYSQVNDIVSEQLAVHAGVVPLVIPTVHPEQVGGALEDLDGLVLPGGGSYVHPSYYASSDLVAGRTYDAARDEVALNLLEYAAGLPDLPVLGSCRGMQEIAVYGGARLRDVDQESAVTHRYVPRLPGGDDWASAHLVTVQPGGLLADLLGLDSARPIHVNSQHSQHVDIGSGPIRVEAVAPDGVVEAISVDWPRRHVLGIQWHVERNTGSSALNRRILQSFGRQCRLRKQKRSA
ncbi:gamma-glutamyl-gamma-aminobutyrate hydrolase family protein [Streptosporangium subroseum]|uniref:gamma-glutamyl-gamma-aminobutyrate hydrolase family protein n=1 Tax=Streptosporangium subroseum TaxID=106412 RepID=UPI00343E23C5